MPNKNVLNVRNMKETLLTTFQINSFKLFDRFLIYSEWVNYKTKIFTKQSLMSDQYLIQSTATFPLRFLFCCPVRANKGVSVVHH